MNFRLKLVENKEEYPYPLLLLADETREAIDKYVYDSDVYVVYQGGDKIAVFCLYRIDEDTIELKNIAIAPSLQGKGMGSILIKEIIAIAQRKGYNELIVGTADCGVDQIRFYERNGFVKYAVKENFFIENYAEPIIENGIQLKDMVMLRMDI